MTTRSVGIVGLGRMGLTLATGFARALEPDCLFAAGRSEASIARVHEAVPSITVVPLAELPNRTALIVLCVRNTHLPAVLDDIRPRLTDQHVLVTINNGLPLQALADSVPGPVAKLIPSVGNEIGTGATLFTPGPGLGEQAVDEMITLLRRFSRPFLITEDQGRAATDLASCGPALLANTARSMVCAQLERTTQLSPDLAEQLIAQSINTVSQLLALGVHLDEIIDRVAVPGGNTAAAVEASHDDLTAAWRAAFQATTDNERAKTLPSL
ncbi:pyrroline-5-carboxylate reductase family protein [Nocardia sp. NPDC050175]|uniref:pyrroline-5-carboxylate reductase family protein n=1 Tax=Nocardia sp. NPDC050175 TaxID=3364317 RepID=UPI0037A36DDA